jgi:hypothetical protein
MKSVAVIIPIYIKTNYEYFRIALQSVLFQTYPKIKIYIVFDGPVEKDIVTYLNNLNNEKITIINNSINKGPGYARNIAIKQIKEDYIAIMDSDDISDKNRIYKQVDFLEKNPSIDIVGTFIKEFNSKYERFIIYPEKHKEIKNKAKYICPMAAPTLLGKSCVFKNNNYNEKYNYGEDYYMILKMLINNVTFANIKEYLYEYRISDDFNKKRKSINVIRADINNRILAMKLAKIYELPFLFFVLLISVISKYMPNNINHKIRSTYKLLLKH